MTARTVTYSVTVPYRTSDRRPVLAASIHYGPEVFDAEALVDSGADRSSFPAAVADVLGIPASGRTPVTVGGVTGTAEATAPDPPFIARVRLRVQGRDINSDALFIPNGGHFLLGRADVFYHFLFGFDQRRQQLLLTPLTSPSRGSP
jgi:hypothetical protein